MKHVWLGAAILAAVVVWLACDAVAEEKAQTMTGTVSVTRDDDDNVTAVTLTVDEKTAYDVHLCKNGKKLAEDADGKKAEVTGVVKTVGDKKTLHVQKFKVIEEDDDWNWE
jgi:hypothetical protein